MPEGISIVVLLLLLPSLESLTVCLLWTRQLLADDFMLMKRYTLCCCVQVNCYNDDTTVNGLEQSVSSRSRTEKKMIRIVASDEEVVNNEVRSKSPYSATRSNTQHFPVNTRGHIHSHAISNVKQTQ